MIVSSATKDGSHTELLYCNSSLDHRESHHEEAE